MIHGKNKAASGSPIRRDDRAEPEDDDAPQSSARIDVVNVDGPGTGSGITAPPSPAHPAAPAGPPRSEVAQGIVSLKQQLARLNEQAAAVERSLDDQRRDRSEALDRLERVTERCIGLETKLAAYELQIQDLEKTHSGALADLQALRGERDDLKARASEAALLRAENRDLHDSLETSMRAAAALEEELDEAKKRQYQDAVKVTELGAELVAVRARLDRASAGAQRAAELEKSLAGARDEAKQTREEVSTLRRELAVAKEDNAKDRATARDRIDLLERALDDARAASTRTEAALEASRVNEDTMARQLEAAMQRAAEARERAAAAQSAQQALEQNVRRLREAIGKAFAKIGHGTDKPPVPMSSGRRTSSEPSPDDGEPISLPPDFMASVPPSARPPAHAASVVPGAAKLPSFTVAGASDGLTPATSGIVQASHGENARSSTPGTPSAWQSMASRSSAPPGASSTAVTSVAIKPAKAPGSPSLALDSDWPAPEAEAPAASTPPAPEARAASQAPAVAAPSSAAPAGSIPPPTYASVPPQIHALDDEPARDEASSDATPSNAVTRHSLAPATRRGGMSSIPPSNVTTISQPPDSEPSREELLARLVDPARSESAARELKTHPDWLRSMPPPTLVAALQSVDYDADRPVFDLARQWEREPLCHALIASLRSEPDARLREHAAWLLKHLAAPSSWKAIADFARSDEEGLQLRRWLLEALDRLAAGRHVGWRELGDVVSALAKHPDASLRDGVVGILVSLDRSDEKRRILLEILRSDDDEVVLASAVDALAGALPVELDPNLVERLLGHPSARVQRSVRDLIERSKKN
ncbi:MAG: hypothetical protein JWP97_4172 [Labilithrix sp.]|nr:hypothetical protein [Labilithrix sp.]